MYIGISSAVILFMSMNVCRMKKKTKSDGYKRQGEVHRVSGFMHEDNYDTTLRKDVAPLLDKAANYNKCHLVMAEAVSQICHFSAKNVHGALAGLWRSSGGLRKARDWLLGCMHQMM